MGIIFVLLMGYAYFHYAGEYYTLVSIGLVSFAAVAQFAPSLLIGIFWKRGTRTGALLGLLAGFSRLVLHPVSALPGRGRIDAPGIFWNTALSASPC